LLFINPCRLCRTTTGPIRTRLRSTGDNRSKPSESVSRKLPTGRVQVAERSFGYLGCRTAASRQLPR
jgi:hypothetical protein